MTQMRANARPPIGWPLLPLPNAEGELVYPSLEASVRQQIEVILRTRPGQQLARPTFGGGLQQFLFQPNTLTTRSRIQEAIIAALERYEARILLDRVDIEEVPDQPTHLVVEIGYRLRRTGAPARVALTLQLES